MKKTEELVLKGLNSGADKCSIIKSSDINATEKMASMCINETFSCPSYGKSKNCPPNVEGPSLIWDLIKRSEYSITILILVPEKDLYSDNRKKYMIKLHKAVSSIEKEVVDAGFTASRGFAGGSCKDLFCFDHDSCSLLQGELCRNPEIVRPSISGYGIDAGKLFASSGWRNIDKKEMEGNSWIIGLVIVA